MSLHRVVIVGKPNVGKSRLFNRLVGFRHSVVFDQPGTTRDPISLEVNWFGKTFLLIDTGGYTNEDMVLQDEINRQTNIALTNADLILFVVSYKEEINNDDLLLAKNLKKHKAKNILVVANKCDCNKFLDVFQLGFGPAIDVSSEHGINTGQLLNEIISRLSYANVDSLDFEFKIAIIGKPNVGKSSLLNSIIGHDQIITSDISGTTRDAIDLPFKYKEKNYLFVDTPGIKKNSSIKNSEVEKYSLLRAQTAIKRANLILFVLDIFSGIVDLDTKVGSLLYKANIPVIIIANKWDLIEEKTDKSRTLLELEIRKKIKFLFWAPIIFISAKDKHNLNKIFEKIQEIKSECSRQINQSLLNDFLGKISSFFSVPSVRGAKLKIFSIQQIKSQVPAFLMLCNNPELLHFSYARMVENQIRSSFGYKITPISVIYKKK